MKKPVRSKTMKVCVVGGGIVGLSSALRLKERFPGLQVSVQTKDTTPNTTSDGAAGLWTPFLAGNNPEIREWSRDTFELMLSIWRSEESSSKGVSLLSVVRIDNEDPKEGLADIVFGFQPLNVEQMQSHFEGVSGAYGCQYMTFVLEPSRFLPFLLLRLKSLGVEVETGVEISDFDQLLKEFDVVVNCTGIGAKKIINDDQLRPIRGQVCRVEAPWITFSKDRFGKFELLDQSRYVIPNQDEVVLGGTKQKDNYDLAVNKEDHERIWEGAKSLFSLDGAKINRNWVGLRPGRTQIRLETEQRDKGHIIHNYGHGGSGITLFWGCAKQVCHLLKLVMEE